MPELPEVETIKSDLGAMILNIKISGVKIFRDKSVKNRKEDFVRILKGNEITEIERRGKLLMMRLKKDDSFLLVHLRMTGQLVFCDKDKLLAGGGHSDKDKIGCLPGKHTRVHLEFANGKNLFFNDQRVFGYLKIVKKSELPEELKNFGPEPLGDDFNFDYFWQKIRKRKASIKAVLLDQKIIAGIGNIYADEVLFASGILPWRTASSLKRIEAEKIIKNTKIILKKAIKSRGTTFNNYVDGHGRKGNFVSKLKVYGRAGEKCFSCEGVVKKTRTAQRGTHYCGKCQR
jgi:formamidopyrimidine-DNA glycosylase